jgi:hypothetical protein
MLRDERMKYYLLQIRRIMQGSVGCSNLCKETINNLP